MLKFCYYFELINIVNFCTLRFYSLVLLISFVNSFFFFLLLIINYLLLENEFKNCR